MYDQAKLNIWVTILNVDHAPLGVFDLHMSVIPHHNASDNWSQFSST